VAELTYLLCVALLLGGDALRLLPVGISLAMIALVPATSLFAAIVASLISSRVRTFNTAQQISGLALIPLWAVVIGLSFKLQDWGTLAVVAFVAGLFIIDAALTLTAANTWRREEVLSKQ
jgi:ABC-type Na+ efflux pump permease subunit